MARCYHVCGKLYVCLFLFLRISSTLSNTDHFLYELQSSHQKPEHSLVLELLENENAHTNHKRDIPIQSHIEGNKTSHVLPETQTTTAKTLVPATKKESDPLQTVILQSNVTKIASKAATTTIKNVDENEPSQRKNTTHKVPAHLNLVNNASEISKSNETNDHQSSLPSDQDTEEGKRKFNQTLKSHNITAIETDPILFYNSSFITDPKLVQYYWVDMTNRTNVTISNLLSNSHRRAATIKLSFEFPFYGHLIKNVTIATGGFLYTGDYVHSWLAATQYIAPLMANFDTSLSNDSNIKYYDNGTAFTVEWEKVSLQDKPVEGEFTFQVTLLSNGDIVFVYKDVPIFVKNIQDVHHPVKVGLSDAYILDRTVFFVRRKTIYEYNRVNLSKEDIKNWTIIYLKALPTCLENHDCTSCLTREVPFKCTWCPKMNKCSTGFDRHRQIWLAQSCDKKLINNETMCSQISKSEASFHHESSSDADDPLKDINMYSDKIFASRRANEQEEIGVSGIIAILFLIAMATGLSIWIFYAYRNPHTTSGQILIRYRPSQWRWRRGEARYTAATIHM